MGWLIMILGIMGGMGPLATCDLFQKIIELTDAATDKEHLHVIIDNNTQIPDRTDYIMGYGKDPRIEMIRTAIRLEVMGIDYMAIPCNTAHYFYDDIVKHTKVKTIHMIEETAVFLNKTNPDTKSYLLLATKGTYKSNIYKNTFEKFGLSILEPTESDKEIIMDWIYKVKSAEFTISKKTYTSLIGKYVDIKNSPVILGCTELPILANEIGLMEDEYIDPTLILAKHCVELAQKESQT